MTPFSAVTEMVLRRAGWRPQRNVTIDEWLQHLHNLGYPIFPALVTALEEFGGLVLDTRPFEVHPFMIDGTHTAVMKRRMNNPFLEFMPQKAEASNERQARLWRNCAYLQAKRLDIAPLGVFWLSHHSPVNTLFLVSDGSIFGGNFYSLTVEESVPALFFLGTSVPDMLNTAIEHTIAYW